MLEYFRMVGKGGKEKEEKTLESEPGNKPIDTASLIAALHPFGQGGVKFARSTKLWTMFSHLCCFRTELSPCTAQACEYGDHLYLFAFKRLFSWQTSPPVQIIFGSNQSSLCLNIHSQSAPQQHVSCSVSCCVFQMSPKSCLMLDPSAALKAKQHKTRT